MKFLLVLAAGLLQVLGSPITQPLQTDGDLNMPGFALLNMALNDGIVDVAPGLARMPVEPNDDIAGTLSIFFDEMAFSCYFHSRPELAESFMALKDMAPDIEKLVELRGLEKETWDYMLALRAEGLAVINLRTFIADAIEVMEGPVADLISSIREQVNSLRSDKQELVALKMAVKNLIAESQAQFALQNSDLAEILRILANQLGDLGNNRDNVSADMMTLFKAVNKQKADLMNAVTYITEEWTRIKKGLTRVVGSAQVEPIAADVDQFGDLVRREIVDMNGALLHTINMARESYAAMLVLFPGANFDVDIERTLKLFLEMTRNV